MEDNLKNFVEQTNNLSEKVASVLFEGIIDISDKILKKELAHPLVIMNASLRASMILLAKVTTTMSFEAEHKPPKDEDEFYVREAGIFEQVVTAMAPLVEKNIKAITLRTTAKGGDQNGQSGKR